MLNKACVYIDLPLSTVVKNDGIGDFAVFLFFKYSLSLYFLSRVLNNFLNIILVYVSICSYLGIYHKLMYDYTDAFRS
jgi:hypothetical protein